MILDTSGAILAAMYSKLWCEVGRVAAGLGAIPLRRVRDVARRQAPYLVLACAALTFINTWLNLSGRSEVLPHAESAQSVLYACRLLSLVAMIALCRFVHRHAAHLSMLSGVVLACGTVMRVMAAQSDVGPSPAMSLVGTVCCGLGYLPCILLVYYGLAQAVALKAALVVVLVALVGKQQLPSLVVALPSDCHPWALLGISLLLTGALWGFWHVCPGVQAGAGRLPSPLADDAVRYVATLGGIAGFALFAFGAVSGIGLVGNNASSATHGAILTASGKLVSLAVFLVLTYATIIRKVDSPLAGRFILAFVALALSTTLATMATVFGGLAAADIVTACLMGIYDFNQFLVWTLFVCVAQGTGVSALRSAIAITVVYDTLATFVGPLSVDAFSAYGSSFVTVIGLVVIIAVTVVLPFAMARSAAARDDAGQFKLYTEATVDIRDHETRASLKDALAERCGYVARQYGLTSREGEVFCLLCQGRSRAAICRELCMSEGTVKTHIAHIYAKTGVNTREAIAEIVFADTPGAVG